MDHTPIHEYGRVLERCRSLPPPKNNYLESDYVINLMETVLDYQLRGDIVAKATRHYKENHWDTIRTLDDLESFLAKFPNDRSGNTEAAKNLWGYSYWSRIRQLRDLVNYFKTVGVSDQSRLRRWAENSSFQRDFKGRVKGLALAVYQWLIMRQGVETVKPDVHIKRFLKSVTYRDFRDEEAIALLEKIAVQLGLKAYELDWRIWEHQRTVKKTGKRSGN